jgi:hypothetical protein
MTARGCGAPGACASRAAAIILHSVRAVGGRPDVHRTEAAPPAVAPSFCWVETGCGRRLASGNRASA